ncbi:AraC family transcriptional regulator [Simiduia agarivorans]|uniref:AraC family transcriptional regulator n=1 Tax=Simiduia agarivorans (strain DSM 21679 / JCM 13881 / BCRC 17597 / SA1) TaxID=1117647 RepID=K4KM58_SIMAS|nr:helix-turn-helix domain-containing protein [Simiduia agarivorans]AFV00117.1 AraC family transcriptional regulator [Simiduia agarivorans SA1 = DSM 21679]
MATVLFNGHDLVLLTTMFVAAFCAACVVPGKCRQKAFTLSAVGFFLSSGAIALDTLINFGSAFHPFVVAQAPGLIYLFEFGAWLQAPFGFLMIASLLDAQFKFKPVYWLLFCPFLLHSLHQLVLYHSLPVETKIHLQQSTALADVSTSWFFVQLAREIFRLTLALMAAYLVLQWWQRTSASRPARWPLAIACYWVSFSFIGMLVAAMLLAHTEWQLALPVGATGLSQNYLALLGLSCALFYYVRDALLLRPLVAIEFSQQKDVNQNINPAYVAKLEELMERQKQFTDPGLSLESLARQMQISTRTLSSVINGYYGCSFAEYINRHRLKEAKRLLIEKRSTTVLDIMYAAGFNSKATFNGVFKRTEGVTPSQYRKQSHALSH